MTTKINGTTDYVELYCYSTAAGTSAPSAITVWFDGFLARRTAP